MTATEWMRKNANSYQVLSEMIKDCELATGSPDGSIRKLYMRLVYRGEINRIQSTRYQPKAKTGVTVERLPEQTRRAVGISAEELRAKFDTRYIVSKAVAELKPDVFLTEAEFIQSLKLRSLTGYRSVIDHSMFAKYKGKASGVTYWGHPDGIAELKADGVLT
jgi:hypothetical protein